MFSPQENIPQEPEPRRLNTDPREQSSEYQAPLELDPAEYSSYEQGYSGYASHMEGEKLRPSPSSTSKRKMWLIIAIIVLIAFGGSTINAILGFVLSLAGIALVAYVIWRLAFNQVTQLPTQSFQVGNQPELIINNSLGAIRIYRGSVNAVEVRATRYYSSFLSKHSFDPLNVTQQENQIRVEARGGDIGRVDLEIVTPEFSNLHVRSDASTVRVDGVRGQTIIHTNAGSIDIKNASLFNHSAIETNAGTINLQNASLEGDTRLETNAGTITFVGSVNPGSQYSFETNAGTVDVALPAHTAFTLDAKTDLGTVSNRFGSNTVGEGLPARLRLRTNLGTITVRPLSPDNPISASSL